MTSVLNWIKEYTDVVGDSPLNGYADLADGVVLYRMMNSIEPSLFPEEDLIESPGDNKAMQVDNANAFLQNMQEYYEVMMYKELNIGKWDVAEAVEKRDEQVMREWAELVVVAAVESMNNEVHIQQMQKLGAEDQRVIMEIIEAASAEEEEAEEEGGTGTSMAPGMDSTINFEVNNVSGLADADVEKALAAKAELEQQAETLMEQVDEARAELERTLTTNAELQAKVEVLEAKVERLETENADALESRNADEDLRSDNEYLNEQLHTKETEMAALRGELTEKEAVVQSLQRRVGELETRLEAAESEARTTQEELRIWQQKGAAGAASGGSEEAAAMEQSLIANLRGQLKEANAKVEALGSKNAELEQAVEAAKASAATQAATQVASASEANSEELKRVRKELEEAERENYRQLKEHGEEVKTLHGTISQLREELSVKDKELNAFKLQNLEVMNQLETTRGMDALRAGAANSEEARMYQEAALELQEKLKKSMQTNVQLDKDLKEAKEIMSRLDEEANARQNKLVATMKKRVNDYKAQIEVQLEEKNTQIDRLKERIQQLKDTSDTEQQLMMSVFYDMGMQVQRLQQMSATSSRLASPRGTLGKLRNSARKGMRKLDT